MLQHLGQDDLTLLESRHLDVLPGSHLHDPQVGPHCEEDEALENYFVDCSVDLVGVGDHDDADN